jgi:UDP-N-acetylglucosamine:LPS N-acetylglucosamine transferase
LVGLAGSIIDLPDIVVVSSAGGVLLDVLALRPWFTDRPVRWVAELAPDTHAELTGEPVTWANEDRGAAAVMREIFRARRKLRRWRPQVLVSAGTAVAVPWFIAARLVGVPSVWVETWNLVGSHQGIAARICARMARAVIVQRPERLALHRRAVLAGELY